MELKGRTPCQRALHCALKLKKREKCDAMLCLHPAAIRELGPCRNGDDEVQCAPTHSASSTPAVPLPKTMWIVTSPSAQLSTSTGSAWVWEKACDSFVTTA
eukprot:1158841-Pelagomonas_calceolata.AAC.1